MDSKLEALDLVKFAVKQNKNFILQGGAGSGKTESLKQIIEHITHNYPSKRIACITYTNLAANELKARLPNSKHHISTIHSFISLLIADYRKNIQSEFHTLFVLEELQEFSHHDDYKKLYEKYSDRLYRMKKEVIPKVIGKREYDIDSSSCIKELNKNIIDLNKFIKEEVSSKKIEKNSYKYNDTRFNSWKNQTFSHDSLLKLAFEFSNNYPTFNKIIADSYDFILIDEFQDTQFEVFSLFKNVSSQHPSCVIGLFGDSMQHIYDAGIGNVSDFDKTVVYSREGIENIEKDKFCEIFKEDNYRCSFEVVNLINHLRNDQLKQEVFLKKKDKGILEEESDRKGMVTIFPVLYGRKPHQRSEQKDKNAFLEFVDNKIKELRSEKDKVLFLTNRAISIELQFDQLYNIFDKSFIEVKDEIESELAKVQLWDLLELCDAYDKRQYTFIIDQIKSSGFKISSIEDKVSIGTFFEDIKNEEYSAMKVLGLAFEKEFLRKSESYEYYIRRKDEFLKNIEEDDLAILFEKLLSSKDITTTIKLNKYLELPENQLDKDQFEKRYSFPIVDKQFEELMNDYKRKVFYKDFFSEKLKFIEMRNYYRYFIEDNDSQFITMHKTKGSGIDNVFIVLEEYFWTQYNFERIYNPEKNKDAEDDQRKMQKNLNLLYVAASRAKKNLKILRVLNDEADKEAFIRYFSDLEGCEIILDS
ncbi:MAG TPA: AAA family ATPase [Aliarcobacter thereius]|nr:UvrD-helicase domain-containing protein [Aliarcobacter thereius]HJE03871.1 AAA family ATPase [Aliarcobacter thereius]